ncbi:MAG: DEAD/DEAH box helicase [Candidatus Gottesmanbacteria bacterium]
MQGFNNKHQQNRGFLGNGNGRRGIKRLNPNLFIKKATDVATQVEYVASARFADYAISDKIKRNIEEHGYTIPTAIQEKSIPEILLGRDVIGIANTGTGKTAAFLITLINKCMLDHNQRVLIVVPTRELACQIRDEFFIFGRGTGLDVTAIIGGANIQRQKYALRRNPHFVIGTPGRLTDLVDRGELNLNLFGNVVLDEVDRMVDIGFIKDIKYLVSYLPKVRQSLFFSATVDGRTQEILREFVTNPVTVSVKQQNTVEHIDQNIVHTGGKVKIEVLHDLLIQPGFDKVIIFGRTKWGMDKLSHALVDRGFKTATIHGNKSQGQRQRALSEFKNNRQNILIATDVAARGIDIDGVTHVINYDAPETYDDYIHRIGRTGRAGKQGIALTFVD